MMYCMAEKFNQLFTTNDMDRRSNSMQDLQKQIQLVSDLG